MTPRPTPAQIAALRKASERPYHHGDRADLTRYQRLCRMGLVTISVERGANYQRAGWIVTDAGLAVLANYDASTVTP